MNNLHNDAYQMWATAAYNTNSQDLNRLQMDLKQRKQNC